MLSKSVRQWIAASIVISSTLAITSCGFLGEKEKPKENTEINASGCLDNSKDLVGRFVDGQVDEGEWKAAFECINKSLDFFTAYVRGTTDNSYTQKDMYTLITGFLITNGKVNYELMGGAFNLKAALFGGDAYEFTKEEIALLKQALERLQVITSELIPYLKRRSDPGITYAELLEMVAAFKRAGEQLGDYVETLPLEAMSDKALEVLITQLTETLGLPVIEGLDRKVFLAKWMMFNTRRDAIESSDWAQFFKTAMHVGGMALAYKTGLNIDNPNNEPAMDKIGLDYHFREFMWELALLVKPMIQSSLAHHNGSTPFPLFDHLVDELPSSFLRNVPPHEMKNAIRPFIQRLLQAGSDTGLDSKVVNTVYGFIEETVKDWGLLDRFYETSGLDRYNIQPLALKNAMDQYHAQLKSNDQVRFANLKQVVFTYQPLLYKKDVDENGDELYAIHYKPNNDYSRYQLFLTVSSDRFIKHIMRTYGSSDQYFLLEDLGQLWEEYKIVLNGLQLLDSTISRFHAKRFQDMDLFTPASDGDQKVKIEEAVNYVMMVVSSATLAKKMRKEITPRCEAGRGEDNMGWERIPSVCFRTEFHDRLAYWIDSFPRLKAYWQTLSLEEQRKGMKWLEHGSRRFGLVENDLYDYDKFDFGAFAMVFHYTETLFTRFDQNGNEILSKSEINKNAFPVFKNLIHSQASQLPNNKFTMLGVFSYIIKYQSLPNSKSFAEIAKLLGWIAVYNFRNYSADRLGVFNIVCQLATPHELTKEETEKRNREVCSQ